MFKIMKTKSYLKEFAKFFMEEYMKPVAILDSAYWGGHYSKITFIVRPLHITLHFLHLYTLKIGLKLHVCVLKILANGLAIPMHMSVFH